MTERALDLGHKSRECFAAFFQRHFTEEIDGQTALAKMSKTKKIKSLVCSTIWHAGTPLLQEIFVKELNVPVFNF
jgi:hypothetical protein